MRATRKATTSFPGSTLTGRWAAVERFLFVEAAARTTQTHIDPFGPSLTPTTTGNNTTVTQYRLTPYIESEPASNLHFRARSDNVQTKDYGLESASINAIDSSYFGFTHHLAGEGPRAAGLAVGGRTQLHPLPGRFVPLESDIVRALVNVAATDTARVGLRVGAERDNFLVDQGWQPMYGGQASWRPSERTSFSISTREHRFFGNGVHLAFTHRMPWLSPGICAPAAISTRHPAHCSAWLPPTTWRPCSMRS